MDLKTNWKEFLLLKTDINENIMNLNKNQPVIRQIVKVDPKY